MWRKSKKWSCSVGIVRGVGVGCLSSVFVCLAAVGVCVCRCRLR